MTKNERLAMSLIALGAASRLIDLPANVTAVGGVTIFGAYSIKNPLLSMLVPIGVMALADAILGWHGTMIYTYGGMILAWIIARVMLSKLTTFRLLTATFLGSFGFWIMSNLGVFLSGYYGMTLQGFIDCYTAALPFWRNSLVGDLISTAAIFLVYEMRKEIEPAPLVHARS